VMAPSANEKLGRGGALVLAHSGACPKRQERRKRLKAVTR